MAIFDKILEIGVEIVPDTSAYGAGDAIGNHASSDAVITFDLAGSATGAGLINSLKVVDNDNEGAAGVLHLYRSAPSALADNAAWAPTLADLEAKIISITLGSFTTSNSMKEQTIEDINKVFKTDGNKIYAHFVTSGTPTYASGKKIYFELGILTQ